MSAHQMAVQCGLRRQVTGFLQTIWVEIPAYCNLACPFCFANGGEPIDPSRLLTWPDYERLLRQAKAMRAQSLGIPGAGEPLLGHNRGLTLQLIRLAAELGMFVTLFTTGEHIDDALADELLTLPVELMVKGTCLNPELMDRFVSSKDRQIHGYGKSRNAVLEMLISKGLNDPVACQAFCGQQTRLGLVLSILTDEVGGLSNLDEVVRVFRFCREHNLVFDADSLLKQGRGASCQLCPSDCQFQAKVLELQQIDRSEYGNVWEVHHAYVGEVCDRYHHHLYVDQFGGIRPCLGSTGVGLGNIKEVALEEAWNHLAMQIIRARRYAGKCAECKHFQQGECNSCLGRSTEGLSTEQLLRDGRVLTVGCWNFDPAL